jgi:hypothetical protein
LHSGTSHSLQVSDASDVACLVLTMRIKAGLKRVC